VQIIPQIFKNTAQNSPKHPVSSEKFIFSGMGLAPPRPLAWWIPLLASNQAFWIRLCLPTEFQPAAKLFSLLSRCRRFCDRRNGSIAVSCSGSSSSSSSSAAATGGTRQRKVYIKKPLNAFMLFMKEMRQKVIDECTLKESAAINQILGRKVIYTRCKYSAESENRPIIYTEWAKR